MFTLRQLETFREVVRTRTTVGAARALRISQPAVSNTIRQMEAQIGFPLFERLGNRLVPTPDADEMFRDSETIFSLYRAFSERVESRRNNELGSLRIVGTHPLVNALIPDVLRDFLADRPGVRVSLDMRRLESVLDAVQTRMSDIGFALAPPEREGLSCEEIGTIQMVCAFSPEHPLNDKVAVSAADLVSTPLVLHESGSWLDSVLRGTFLPEELRANVVAQVRYGSPACLLAEAGLGVTFVDPLTGMAGNRYRLAFRPLYPPVPVPICLLTRSDEAPKRVQSLFAESVKSSKTLAMLSDLTSPAPAGDP